MLQAAAQAADLAYAPYSGFRVGAAVLTPGGTFVGANIETASTNLGTCAERVAIALALMNRQREIIGLAVSCPDAAAERSCLPCGACRQWISELAPRAWVVTSGSDAVYTLADLLPVPFSLSPNRTP